MHTYALRVTRLIHENCAAILTFAFSQPPLAKLCDEKFRGEWKYFDKMCFEIARSRAERSAFELALHFRVLDDEENLSEYLKTGSNRTFGKLQKSNGTSVPLHFRDVTNKIIHSSSFEWDFTVPDEPMLICHPTERDKWLRAEISVVDLGEFCGELMS